ncbi:MAG: electron transfer flavoprotein subunit alpha/FixB family protein, partial [Pseudomonadota bacterium]
MEKANPIWVWTEQRNNRLMDVSIELLGKGLELAERLQTKLQAILIGDQTTELADELIAFGADTVYTVEDSRLRAYQSDIYPNIVADLIKEYSPEIVLIGATNIGMDLAPRVAAKVKTGLTAHCVDLYIDEDGE